MDVTKKRLVFLVFSIATFISTTAAYSDTTEKQVRVNRYTLADMAPSPSQLDLMSVIVDVEFSESVETVGQAIQELLTWHGFKLGHISAGNYSQYVLYLLPLPDIHRQLGPLRLETALRVLGGEGFELMINPVTREVSYHIHDAYDDMLSTHEVIQAKKQWDAKFGLVSNDVDIDKVCEQDTPTSRHTHGPVKAGDFLSKIAFSIKPAHASVEQVMMRLYELNPSAFSRENINYLRRGAVLRLPNDNDVIAMDHVTAKERVRDHYLQWLRIKQEEKKPDQEN